MSNYEPDEFDKLASERKLVGVHLKMQTKRKWWVWLLLVSLVALGLGVITVQVLDWYKGGSKHATTSVTTPTNTPSVVPSVAPSVAPSTAPAPAPTPEPKPDKAAAVRVLNGTGITGLAGAKQRVIQADGFTNLTIGNYRESNPEKTTVYYAQDNQKVTAVAVAKVLGLADTAVSQDTQLAKDGILVVLRQDVSH